MTAAPNEAPGAGDMRRESWGCQQFNLLFDPDISGSATDIDIAFNDDTHNRRSLLIELKPGRSAVTAGQLRQHSMLVRQGHMAFVVIDPLWSQNNKWPGRRRVEPDELLDVAPIGEWDTRYSDLVWVEWTREQLNGVVRNFLETPAADCNGPREDFADSLFYWRRVRSV